MKNKLRAIPLVVIFQSLSPSCASTPVPCTPNWTVTGYYTPVEEEYASALHSVEVVGQGRYSFPQSFLDDVKMEGWGKTRLGWYLGYYGGQWQHSSRPLDATGRPLSVGTIATDPGVVGPGSTVVIADLTDSLSRHHFVARDVGALVMGKHIDVYTGEGRAAHQLTWHITGQRTVCIYSS